MELMLRNPFCCFLNFLFLEFSKNTYSLLLFPSHTGSLFDQVSE